MKKLIKDLSSEIAYLLDNPTTSNIYMVEAEVIANIQDLVTKLEREIHSPLKNYRILKEFFVEASDLEEAEKKSSDEKIKLPYTLIDVHEIKEDDIEH